MDAKIKEAYALMGADENISDEDLKIKFRNLAKKYHPDVFSGDKDKFKTINEAYQLILDWKTNPEKYAPKMPQGGFWGNVADLGDIFFKQDFFRQVQQEEQVVANRQPVQINLNISFHEAILGCSKEISYSRKLKCDICQGAGSSTIGNGCDKCDGFGRSTLRNGGMIFQSSCSKCQGKGVKKNKCEKCNGKKTLDDLRTGELNIPAGTQDQNTLRLSGEGNFAGRHMFGDAYTDVLINIAVEKYKDFILQDNDVASSITLSLLEALEGTTKEVETVYGNKEITVKSKTKNNEQVKIPKCGVKNTLGSHIIKINVEYPDDISNIIEVLKNAVSDPV